LHTENQREALKRKQMLDDEISLERLGLSKKVTIKPIILSEFFKLYFEYATSSKKSSTIRNETTVAKKFEIYLNNIQLDQINAQMLDMWRAELLKSYAPATFNIHRRFLHAAFNMAVKWNYLLENPISKVAKAKWEQKRLFLTPDEFARVLNLIDADIQDTLKKHVRKYNILYRAFFEFLLLTGLRRQEAINLKPEAVDLSDDVLYISNTKGKRDRVVPLHPRAKQILAELDDKLFSRVRPTSVSHKFKMLCFRAKLSENFKLHSLRHSTGTFLNEKGVDISAIQSILGHADIRTTLIYSKVSINKLKRDINRLDVPGDDKNGDEVSK
jgi:integrase